MDVAAFAFLIEHNGKHILFDLGLRKGWKNKSPPSLAHSANFGGGEFEVKKNVSEVLQDNGTSLDSIDAIIWRYVQNWPCRTS